MVLETWVQSQVASYQRLKKMVLDTSLLNTQQYKVLSRVKWSNTGKGIAPSPTLRCSSYWKGSLLVALDYGRQLYFLLYSPFFHQKYVQNLLWKSLKFKEKKSVEDLKFSFKTFLFFVRSFCIARKWIYAEIWTEAYTKFYRRSTVANSESLLYLCHYSQRAIVITAWYQDVARVTRTRLINNVEITRWLLVLFIFFYTTGQPHLVYPTILPPFFWEKKTTLSK